MESKRRKDVRKMTELVTSVETSCAIKGMESVDESPAPLYPEHETEGVWDAYSTVKDWRTIYNVIHDVVMALGGNAKFNFEAHQLNCLMRLVGGGGDGDEESHSSEVSFAVFVYRSRLHKGVHAVRVRRTSGSVETFRKVFTNVILCQCAGVITGLPKSSSKHSTEDDIDMASDEETDDYDEMLEAEGMGFDVVEAAA
jgi:hypothetical protein